MMSLPRAVIMTGFASHFPSSIAATPSGKKKWASMTSQSKPSRANARSLGKAPAAIAAGDSAVPTAGTVKKRG
ncbi:hypothetical protein PA01_18850 [Azoarcus sp. PA01]|nr:hypothetical protein PA01_18850 [Azoarcus sp. PA01]